MPKLYKAKSLASAQRRVRELNRLIEDYRQVVDRFHRERVLLAKLAAKGPAFFNPLEAAAAESVRDEILRRDCRMNPDGSFVQ